MLGLNTRMLSLGAKEGTGGLLAMKTAILDTLKLHPK